MFGICMTYSWQVKDAEHRLRHKLFPPNAWMKLTDFNVLTSCPKDELHQWFLGLYGEHIIPAIVHRYTQVLQSPDLIWHDRNGVAHPIMSNESVARVFRRLRQTSGCCGWHLHDDDFARVCCTLPGGLCQENRKCQVYWWQRVRFLMLTQWHCRSLWGTSLLPRWLDIHCILLFRV